MTHRHGDQVEIEGHLGTEDGATVEGRRAAVVGQNPTYERDGRRFVCVRTEAGELIGAPEQALRRPRGRAMMSMCREAWRRIFGRSEE